MIKYWLSRKLDRMGRHYEYDTAYLQTILQEDFPGFIKFNLFQTMSGHRGPVPVAAFSLASIRSAMREDCGPCVQLVVDMARESGVSADVIRAIVSGDREPLSEELTMVFDFVEQTLNRDPAADALRDAIRDRWGERGLISLGFALAASKVYPTLKYTLGYGKACQRVIVEGAAMAPAL